MSVNEAEALLLSLPQRSRDVLIKLLRSAIANARNALKIDSSRLLVKEIRVDGGPKLKRWMPRARGGVGKIEKKTSHITLILGISEGSEERFLIQKKKKKEKETKKKSEKEATMESEEKKSSGEKHAAKKGVAPKMFSRKAI